VSPPVRQGVAAGVPQHVRMGFKAEPRACPCALDHAGETGRRERRAPFRREHERRLGVLFALEATEGTQFVPEDRMRARRALLDPADVQGGRFEIDLLPQRRSTSSATRRPCR